MRSLTTWTCVFFHSTPAQRICWYGLCISHSLLSFSAQFFSYLHVFILKHVLVMLFLTLYKEPCEQLALKYCPFLTRIVPWSLIHLHCFLQFTQLYCCFVRMSCNILINSPIEWISKSLLACAVILYKFIFVFLVYTCEEFFEVLLRE